MGNEPIFRWELAAGTREGWFRNLKKVALTLESWHFSPWIPEPRIVPGISIAADNVPALPRDEGAVRCSTTT